jgi:transposase-like protein
MPRRETLLMDQRVLCIADYQRDVFDVADLARRYGISRKTAYTWIDRYAVGGPAGQVDRSRRPARSPHATPERVVAALLDVRRHHPTWGQEALEGGGHAATDLDAPRPEDGV